MKKRVPKKDTAGGASAVSRGRAARYAIHETPAPVVAEAAAGHASPRVLSATEAARNFSDLINRVGYRRESYVIERGGKPMCALSPVAAHHFTGGDFLELLESLPRPDAEFLDIVDELGTTQAPAGESPWEN